MNFDLMKTFLISLLSFVSLRLCKIGVSTADGMKLARSFKKTLDVHIKKYLVSLMMSPLQQPV